MKTVETSPGTGSPAVSPAPVPETTKLQRRPSAVVLALVLVCLGGVTGLWLWTSSSAATEVVAVRTPVERGQLIELADLLSFIKRHAIHNMGWLCADVHYTAAHYFDPAQAAYPDFLPFWEFVSGPLHAGSYGPFGADATFGVQVRYSRASPVRGASPAAGFQFFGEVAIDPDSGCLTVQLCDVSGSVLHTEVIAPHPPCV